MSFKKIRSLVAERKVIPFIGAGMSIPSGIPSWFELISGLKNKYLSDSNRQLIEEINKGNINIDLPELSSLLQNMGISNDDATYYFSSILNDYRLEPNEYHNFLISRAFHTIITTNWDILIEKAFRNMNSPFQLIYRNQDVRNYEGYSRCQIIKIHGDINDSESLVYKDSQYQNYWKERQLLFSLILTLFSTHHIFFLGYGFGDINIEELLDTINRNLRSFKREHFALVYNQDSRLFWKKYGITPIKANNFDSSKRNYFMSTIVSLKEIMENTKPIILSNLERAATINTEIRKLIDVGIPRPTLYMRGSLGWISNPVPIQGEAVYGSYEQDCEERKMTELIIELLKKNPHAKVKCILHLKHPPLLPKFTKKQLSRRFEEIYKNFKEYRHQIHISHTRIPSYSNLMIIDEECMISGYKSESTKGINKVHINRKKDDILNNIDMFESDFNSLFTGHDNISSLIDYEITKLMKVTENEIIDLAKATSFAIENHNRMNQKREDKETPYYVHILRVIDRLKNSDPHIENNILIAAALHDVVEDCGVTIDYIKKNWNEQVSILVKEMTYPANSTHQDKLQQVKLSSPAAKLIRLADKLDNISELVRFNLPTFGGIASKDYIIQGIEIVNIISKSIDSTLLSDFELTILQASKVYEIK